MFFFSLSLSPLRTEFGHRTVEGARIHVLEKQRQKLLDVVVKRPIKLDDVFMLKQRQQPKLRTQLLLIVRCLDSFDLQRNGKLRKLVLREVDDSLRTLPELLQTKTAFSDDERKPQRTLLIPRRSQPRSSEIHSVGCSFLVHFNSHDDVDERKRLGDLGS